MLPDTEFDEVVLFDLPAEYADKLWARLARNHLTWLLGTEDGFFVVAALRAELDNLAQLLRDAEAWLAESDLSHVRFRVDGKEYMLRAKAEASAGIAA